MVIRNMDKITFDGDQVKFPASAILQEDLEGDISELKEDFDELKTVTVTEKQDGLTASNPRTACAVQYYASNNTYAFYETEAFRAWNSYVYDVEPNATYSVRGTKYPSTPTVVYMNDLGDYIGHDGYDPNYTDWVAVDNNLTVTTPNGCTKMVVQKLGLATPPTALSITLENKLQPEVTQLKDFCERIDPILVPDDFDPMSITMIDGRYIGYDHSIQNISSTSYKITANISVSEGERIVINASVGYAGNMYYMFLNAGGDYVDGVTSEVAGTQSFYLIVPQNAKTLIISAFNGVASVGTVSTYKVRGKWTGKKWVCLGDSLTEVNSRTTKHYHDYVAEATGITVVNMGDSGSGYMHESDLGTAFYQRAENVPLDADVYTIFGSGNDLSHPLGTPADTGTDTICGCVNNTIDVLIGLIPTIQLGIIAPTPWIGNKPTLDDSNSMGLYVKALKEICYIRSIPFLDLYHESNLRPWAEEGRAACYSKDNGGGVHPDETGHKIIAPRFEAFLDSLII